MILIKIIQIRLTSPFQESMFNDQNSIAKIPNNPNLQQLR